MESITQLKNVAVKTIWGEDAAQKEPISGVNGDVSKGEPYDAGNMEPDEVKAQDTKAQDAVLDETHIAPLEAETAQPKAVETPHTKEPDATKPETPSVNPAKVKGSSILPGDSTKAQNDVRDPSGPDAHHENAAPKENVDDTGSGLDVGDNPDKLNGPGPRPLEVVAKEHGGNAGNSGSDSSVDKSNVKSNGAAKLPGDKTEGHEDGTGELYVKSSGLRADGGDFDAAAPGAGREADRLLEEKGVHPKASANGNAANGKVHGSPNGSDSSLGKEKMSLKSKIKAKLHRKSVTTTAS